MKPQRTRCVSVSSAGEVFKKIYEKLKNERAFFLLFASLIVLSGVLYNPRNLNYMQNTNDLTQVEGSQKRNYGSPIVNINTATIEELQTLPGIGPSKARAIIEYRNKNPFSKPEELINVPGIGQKTYDKLKDRITVGKNMNSSINIPVQENTAEKENTKTKPQQDTIISNIRNKSDNVSSRKININTASVEELQKLPGIGPTKAQAIVDYRQNNGDFKSIEEIKNVKGIGEKTYEKLKDLIDVK